MKLEGIHHVSSITGDAQANVDFYAGVLGLRMVKKTVNQDDPTVYHLFYGDDAGSPGFDLTFFEYPGAAPGRAGLEVRVVETSDVPLTASNPEIPAEFAIQGFEEVRAYTHDPERSRELLEGTLGFEREGSSAWLARGSSRGG